MRVLMALFAAVLFSIAPALADTPAVGMNVDIVAGRQKQSSQRITSLPTVPVPMFWASIPVKRFTIFAEGVPPIGPVSYADGRGTTQATKISYMTFEGRWNFDGGRFALGAGSTLVNQATYYGFRDPVNEQASRVAGFRVSAAARLEQSLHADTEFRMAFSPSMHGVQRSYLRYPAFVCPPTFSPIAACHVVTDVNDSELASLVDLQAARRQHFGRYALRYGIRYINYSARYPNGNAADRERLVMPFVGMEFSIR